jgi:hypothetical protein
MDLGSVKSFEASCVVPDDPGEVVRGARPLCPEDRDRLREQAIARLMAEHRRQVPGGSHARPRRAGARGTT